jgi:hypothetical protein
MVSRPVPFSILGPTHGRSLGETLRYAPSLTASLKRREAADRPGPARRQALVVKPHHACRRRYTVIAPLPPLPGAALEGDCGRAAGRGGAHHDRHRRRLSVTRRVLRTPPRIRVRTRLDTGVLCCLAPDGRTTAFPRGRGPGRCINLGRAGGAERLSDRTRQPPSGRGTVGCNEHSLKGARSVIVSPGGSDRATAL